MKKITFILSVLIFNTLISCTVDEIPLDEKVDQDTKSKNLIIMGGDQEVPEI